MAEQQFMTRGTTPPVEVEVDGDWSDLSLYLSFRQAGTPPLVKHGGDLTVTVDTSGAEPVTTVATSLTQRETLALRAKVPVEVQLRGVRSGGAVAAATRTATVSVLEILQDGELSG